MVKVFIGEIPLLFYSYGPRPEKVTRATALFYVHDFVQYFNAFGHMKLKLAMLVHFSVPLQLSSAYNLM
jgi:hypothetical protein